MKKGIAALLIGLAIILGIITNFNWIYNVISNNDSLQYIVNIIAIISGLSGMIIGFGGYRAANLEAIREYFLQGDATELSEARGKIYDAKNPEELMKELRIERVDKKENLSKGISKINNFYHMWGLMVKKRYLPIWVFKGSSGRQVVKMYDIIKPYIEEKKKDNADYAENFSWLYRKIKKKYKYGD